MKMLNLNPQSMQTSHLRTVLGVDVGYCSALLTCTFPVPFQCPFQCLPFQCLFEVCVRLPGILLCDSLVYKKRHFCVAQRNFPNIEFCWQGHAKVKEALEKALQRHWENTWKERGETKMMVACGTSSKSEVFIFHMLYTVFSIVFAPQKTKNK